SNNASRRSDAGSRRRKDLALRLTRPLPSSPRITRVGAPPKTPATGLGPPVAARNRSRIGAGQRDRRASGWHDPADRAASRIRCSAREIRASAKTTATGSCRAAGEWQESQREGLLVY